ncbi:ABC transporter substrate-binding protein [Mycolicibacterium sp. P9-64]|uniref:ABC transporter substrate-binding protein n=1 Tax=Mycolicibacterium sp. P9-64 TaxID=2024612 RepID=UPI0011F08A16|nr:ABC transporter substrate-binding protein [Mycolicibacterium sp. P9-64]KAA0084559.1 ABC transporter substrate-binding protein [Mycolicibacterium sp. P9-64]
MSIGLRARPQVRTAAAMTAMLVCLSGCGGSTGSTDAALRPSEVPKATTTLPAATWIVEAEPSTLDPIFDFGYYDNTIIANMCEPLVRLNGDLSTSDWLAKSTMVNPTTWTYDLKPGITFWDGSPLTPEDVVYSLGRNLDEGVGSYFSSYYGRVKDVKQTGPSQVTVILKEPDALWNTSTILTSGSYIVSKKFAEAAGKNFGAPGTGVMCTGPYKFGRWTSGDSITMEKNSNYWNHEVDVKTDKFKFVFLTDSAAQANALATGQAQGMYVRDQTIIPRLQNTGGKLYYGPGLTYYFIAPTLKKGPMSNVKIRQALSKVVDRAGIVKSIFSSAGTPLRTLVGEDAWGPNEDVRKVFQTAYDSYPDETVDVEGAKQLVKEAGSPTEKVVVAYPTEGGAYQLKLASVIQDAARSIGLNVELKPLSPAVAAQLYQDPDAMAAADIDMISLSFNVNNADPFGMYQLFDPAAKGVDNYSRWEDPDATRYLAEAAGTYDPVERAKLTVAAEKIIMNALPFIPVMSVNAVLYMGPGVTGAPASFSQIWSAWAADVGGSK